MPPSHCVNCRHIPSERESSPKSLTTVAPVVVNPDIDSKYASSGWLSTPSPAST